MRNFLVAQEKLPGKLQARAIISTRREWIFIAWIFIARNFLPSACSSFIEVGVRHALYTLAFVLERLSTLSQQLFILQRI